MNCEKSCDCLECQQYSAGVELADRKWEIILGRLLKDPLYSPCSLILMLFPTVMQGFTDRTRLRIQRYIQSN